MPVVSHHERLPTKLTPAECGCGSNRKAVPVALPLSNDLAAPADVTQDGFELADHVQAGLRDGPAGAWAFA